MAGRWRSALRSFCDMARLRSFNLVHEDWWDACPWKTHAKMPQDVNSSIYLLASTAILML